ncbi:hypothetical protein EVAR_33164_1 [Eumeta japonica]|uniref:Uncharacterized protein n=1 Tax=Eumeta variegata TaxID=151549 RepID=A0A4C1W2H8_EUMVA|nr:hypothetical protein EVAR_33164_1 [Eumeta japonica]
MIGWREDSSGSEDHDAPHYPLDLRIAEARLQLEERLAQEAREAVRRSDRATTGDTRKSPAEERRTKEPVQFILGGDK